MIYLVMTPTPDPDAAIWPAYAIFGIYADRERAEQATRNINGTMAQLPVVFSADHRLPPDTPRP